MITRARHIPPAYPTSADPPSGYQQANLKTSVTKNYHFDIRPYNYFFLRIYLNFFQLVNDEIYIERYLKRGCHNYFFV